VIRDDVHNFAVVRPTEHVTKSLQVGFSVVSGPEIPHTRNRAPRKLQRYVYNS